MNNSLLNATPFSGSAIRIDSQFRSLLVCCIKIYNDIIAKNKRTKNDEETIRDLFFDEYLNDDNYRNQNKELEDFHFEKEPKENIGYLDIKAKKLNPYVSTKAYFVIECKRLDSNNSTGETGLNAEYVKNGICRFVTDYYSSYFEFYIDGKNTSDKDIYYQISLTDGDNITDKARINDIDLAFKLVQVENGTEVGVL